MHKLRNLKFSVSYRLLAVSYDKLALRWKHDLHGHLYVIYGNWEISSKSYAFNLVTKKGIVNFVSLDNFLRNCEHSNFTESIAWITRSVHVYTLH